MKIAVRFGVVDGVEGSFSDTPTGICLNSKP